MVGRVGNVKSARRRAQIAFDCMAGRLAKSGDCIDEIAAGGVVLKCAAVLKYVCLIISPLRRGLSRDTAQRFPNNGETTVGRSGSLKYRRIISSRQVTAGGCKLRRLNLTSDNRCRGWQFPKMEGGFWVVLPNSRKHDTAEVR